MTRADAEAAIREFDDYDWNGSVLRVSWSSKQVPIPSRPAYGAYRTTAQDLTLQRRARTRGQ